MKARVLLAGIGIGAMAAVVIAGTLLNGELGPLLLGIRAEFFLFGMTLIGVALFHDRTLEVALTGLVALLILKFLTAPDFDLPHHAQEEARTLLNLLGLLLGFSVLARHFESSQIPEILPRYLPDDWKGGFMLLAMVFVLSAFLDNIAAAMIGGTVALHVFRRRLDIGYLAAIVAASNAGGAGSVVGDTTTTMMWIEGVAAHGVLHAYVAAVPAFLIFAVLASHAQHARPPSSSAKAWPFGRRTISAGVSIGTSETLMRSSLRERKSTPEPGSEESSTPETLIKVNTSTRGS
jgi:hypothetical protein